MSLWVERPREGEIQSIHVEPMTLVLALGLIVSLYAPRLLSGPVTIVRDGMAITTFGFGCLVFAKVSLFRRGVWFSWGPAEMGARSRWVYRAGYVMMLLGIAMIVGSYGATP